MINNCDMIYSFVHLARTILNVRLLLIVDFFVHLCPLNIIDTPTRNGKAREHKARVWVNTILGVASSTNYYFTRRSYTSSARILFYRDIIVELECHGVTPPPLARFVSRNECRRLLDISPSKKISLTLETEDSLFHFCLAAKKKKRLLYRLTVKCTIYIDLYRCF